MNLIGNMTVKLQKLIGFYENYVILFFNTFLTFIIIHLLCKLITKVFSKFVKNNKRKFEFTHKIRLVGNSIFIIISILIWQEYISTFMTLISFVSAAITIALRDIVFNFFSGIYIIFKKPFTVEDRIEIDGVTGDVISIKMLSFELLEVNNEDGNNQSTGKIIHIPSSKIFSATLVNQTKIFKYVWDEIKVKVDLESNIKEQRGILYRIVNSQDIIKKIPNKMTNQLANDPGNYRIYYNKLTPIVYTKLEDDFVLLTIRYLIHPKKSRIVETDIWNEIIKSYKNNELKLHMKKKD